MLLRGLICSLVLLIGAGAAPIKPFTIDTVMEDLAKTHPEARRVADAPLAGVKAWEDLVYRSVEGLDLGLDVYRPERPGALPAVLVVHGGGWLSGDRRMERPFARHLALKGYVVVPVSYRLGTPGRFPAPLHDLKAAVRWLRAHAAEYGIDPRKIVAAGGSAGGSLACLLGASNGLAALEGTGAYPEQSSKVQAVVDIDGSVSFMDNALIQSSEQKPNNPYWEFVHGTYREHPDIWLAASSLMYVGPKSAPVLFIKSTVSQPILVGRDEMSERLKLFGIPSRVMVYPNTPHPFWLVEPWFSKVIEDSDAFLKSLPAAQ